MRKFRANATMNKKNMKKACINKISKTRANFLRKKVEVIHSKCFESASDDAMLARSTFENPLT